MNTYTHNGREYAVEIEHDQDMGHPWVEHDGHGPVRESRNSHRSQQDHKSPGERPLNAAGRNETQFYYNWQGAIMLAKREGWGAVVEGETATQRAERAVSADFEHLRRYLADQWHWAIITVSWGDYSESLGGCEYDYTDASIADVLADLAGEIEARIADDKKTALVRLCEARKHMHGLLRALKDAMGRDYRGHIKRAIQREHGDAVTAICELRALGVQA